MSTVRVGENESLDSALRRFKRKCARDGIIGDLRKKEAYEKPSVKRKKKAEAARKRMYKSRKSTVRKDGFFMPFQGAKERALFSPARGGPRSALTLRSIFYLDNVQ